MTMQASLLGDDNNVRVKGTLERVTYHNAENGYAVLKFNFEHLKGDTVAAVGSIVNPNVGSVYALTGHWAVHPKFGKQFVFDTYEEQRPDSLDGIRMFLASGIVKGIGKITAERIVNHFGLDTFKILDNNPEKLLEVPKMSKKVVESVKQSWAEQGAVRELMVFLNPLGIGTALALRIYRYYGENAIDIIKENPYRLAMDVDRIGFQTADQFALNLGFDENSPMRAEAATLYTLIKQIDDGHVYFPKERLINIVFDNWRIDPQLVEDAVDTLEKEDRIVKEFFDEHTAIYLKRYHHCETKISFYLNRLLISPKVVHFKNPQKAIEDVLQALPMKLEEKQEEAVRVAVDSKIMILTGGPGTGKTTITNAIIQVFQKAQAKILLAAPTGRAAKRMSETTGLESKTIHRLLEYNPQEDGFAKNENNPLNCSLLVIDETSMVDIVLMYHLIKAVPLGCTLIFVGDINQLPSVGAGNVLRDCIISDVIPIVELNHIFRQAAKSMIIQNAHKINEGEIPSLYIDKKGLSDFYFFPEEDSEIACQTIVDLVTHRISKKFALNPFEDIQVLSPMLKGSVGVNNLNTQLQVALNPHGILLQKRDKNFRMGDKVMQIKNNYDKDIYNGDIGIITHIDLSDKSMTVRFDDNFVPYSYEELDELVLAYAISIHKSQGGEYPCVIVPLLTSHHIMLQRNLVYTAVTRGKKLVVMVGSKKALSIAVHNNQIKNRFTKLADRLRLAKNLD